MKSTGIDYLCYCRHFCYCDHEEMAEFCGRLGYFSHSYMGSSSARFVISYFTYC